MAVGDTSPSSSARAGPRRSENRRAEPAHRRAALDQLPLLLPTGNDKSSEGEHQCHRVSWNPSKIDQPLPALRTNHPRYRMAAVGCCLIGGICLAFLPFCMEMCHDCHHFCTLCGQKVAMLPHDGPVQLFAPQPPVLDAPGAVQPPQPVAMTHDPSGKN